jgi:putative addiction module component (TIGR02574 family)
MSDDVASLDITKLSVRERLELIDHLWDSLPESVQIEEVPAWHVAELAPRRAEAWASPAEGRPWREVLDSLGSKS